MFATAETTVAISALIDVLNHPVAADHRYVAAGSAPSEWSHSRLSDIKVHSTTGTASLSAFFINQELDPWIEEVNQHIDAQRTYVKGWDGASGLAPDQEALDFAARLADFFAILPMAKRPHYDLDCDGRPTFALYDDKVYLHLTVDSEGVATWYTVVDGQEAYSELAIDEADIRTFAKDLIQLES